MEYPIFLDFEGSSHDEESYPIAASWSLPDGTIKSVLIMPEDDWTDWDQGTLAARGITREHLFEQGYSALDVLREMNEDMADAVVYVDGLDYDREWLDKLFEAYGEEPNFEIATITQCLPQLSYDEFLEERNQLLEEGGFSPYDSESNVLMMLKLAHLFMAED